MAERIEIASAYVSFTNNFGDFVKQTDKMVRTAEKGFGKIEKALENVEGQIDQTEKSAKSLSKTMSSLTSVGSLMGSVLMKSFTKISSILIGGVKKGFEIVGKTAVGAFNIAKTAVTGYLKTLARIPLEIAKLPRYVMGSLKTISRGLEDMTKKFVFLQLDIRYILDQTRKSAIAFGSALAGTTYLSASFERAFVKVRKVLDMTEEEFSDLEKRLQSMSGDMTNSAKELADLAAIGGQLGITGVRNIEMFTEVMAKLAKTTNIAGEAGAANFAKLMNVMGIGMDKMENMGSTMVALGNNFAAFENEILDMAFKVAGAGKIIGLTTQEVFALSTAMVAAGVRAERGGTAMSRALIEMANAVEDGGKQAQKFAKVAGVSVEEFSKLVRTQPVKAIEMFILGLQDLDEAGENVFQTLEELNLNQIRTRDVILRLVGAGELLSDTVGVANEAWRENIALDQEFAKMMKALWHQIEALKNQFIVLAQKIGAVFTPILKEGIIQLRIFLSVLNNIDPKRLKSIANLIALGTAIFGIGTAVLMATKAIFTFITGLTLLARGVVRFARIWLTLKMITAFLSLFGLNLEDIFNVFSSGNLGKLEKFRNILEDIIASAKESEFVNNVSEAFREMVQEVRQLSNSDLPIDIKLINISASGIEFITTFIKEVSSAIEQAVSVLVGEGGKTIGDRLFKGRELAVEIERVKSYRRLGEAFGSLFVASFELAFQTIPSALIKLIDKKLIQNEEIQQRWKAFWDGMAGEIKVKWYGEGEDVGLVTQITEQLETARDVIAKWRENVKNDNGDTFANFIDSLGLSKKDARFASALIDVFKEVGGLVLNIIENALEALGKSEKVLTSFRKLGESLTNGLIDALSTSTKLLGVFADLGFAFITGVFDGLRARLSFMDSLNLGGSVTGKYQGRLDYIGGSFTNARPEASAYYKSQPKTGEVSFAQVLDSIQTFLDWLYSDYTKHSTGTIIPGYGGGDQIPALLERGEAVVPKNAVRGGLSGVAQWFKSIGAPGFQGGALIDSVASGAVSSLSLISPELQRDAENMGKNLKEIQDMIENGVNTSEGILTAVEKLSDTLFNSAMFIVKSLASALKSILPETWGDKNLHQLIDNAVSKIESVLNSIRTGSIFGEQASALEKYTRQRLEQYQPDTPQAFSDMSLIEQMLKVLKINVKPALTELVEIVAKYNENLSTKLGELQTAIDRVVNIGATTKEINSDVAKMNENFAQMFNFGAEGSKPNKFAQTAGQLATLGVLLSNNTYGSGGEPSAVGLLGSILAAGGNPIGGAFLAVNQLVNAIAPGRQLTSQEKGLQAQAYDYNKMIKDWGGQYRVTDPNIEKDWGFLGWRHLFGNPITTFTNKDAVKKGIEHAQAYLQSMQTTFNQASQGLFSSLVNDDDFATFSQAIGSRLQQVLYTQLTQSGAVAQAMKNLSSYMQDAVTDGLSQGEISHIKQLMEAIKNKAKPWQEVMQQISEEFMQAEESANNINSSVKNAPAGFKTELARYRAILPGVSTGNISPSEAFSGGSKNVTVNFYGDTYGQEDLKAFLANIFDEYLIDKSYSNTGNPSTDRTYQ